MRLAISPICGSQAARIVLAIVQACRRAGSGAHLVPLQPILGLERAAVLLLELPQLVVHVERAAEVRLPQPLPILRQVAQPVEELLPAVLERDVLVGERGELLLRRCHVG